MASALMAETILLASASASRVLLLTADNSTDAAQRATELAPRRRGLQGHRGRPWGHQPWPGGGWRRPTGLRKASELFKHSCAYDSCNEPKARSFSAKARAFSAKARAFIRSVHQSYLHQIIRPALTPSTAPHTHTPRSRHKKYTFPHQDLDTIHKTNTSAPPHPNVPRRLHCCQVKSSTRLGVLNSSNQVKSRNNRE